MYKNSIDLSLFYSNLVEIGLKWEFEWKRWEKIRPNIYDNRGEKGNLSGIQISITTHI